MNKPIAVLISDVHYSLATLSLADNAMRQAVAKANALKVPLIVAGDLHDTKANLRGECVNAMIKTFKLADRPPVVIIGNHDRINEKSPGHSLTFLEKYAHIVSDCGDKQHIPGIYYCSYFHDPEELKRRLATCYKGSTIIMHQGVEDSHMGDYIQDRSALSKEVFRDFRVISGHYHRRQDIICGPPRKGAVGLFSYIGNPYTLSYGEAEDPEKGFRILMSDGTLAFVPTNLRKHVVIKFDMSTKVIKGLNDHLNDSDLVWVQVTGTPEQIRTFDRKVYAKEYRLPGNFRLTFDQLPVRTSMLQKEVLKGSKLLDAIIDSQTTTSDEMKTRLKILWKEFV